MDKSIWHQILLIKSCNLEEEEEAFLNLKNNKNGFFDSITEFQPLSINIDIGIDL